MAPSAGQSALQTPIECGQQARQEFSFSSGYTNLNHGSFGAVPDCVRAFQRSLQDESESRPDIFLRYTFPALVAENRKAIAEYLAADASDVVFVPNSTTGINTVLRNLIFREGDVCIYFSTIYGAIEKAVAYLTEITPLRSHKIDLVYPVPDADIVRAFNEAVHAIRQAGGVARLAVFDNISSVPGIAFPTRQILCVCREQSIMSMVDGAHCAGHMPMSLKKLDPDFFVTNLHKWLFVPRPCAVLYVARRCQHLIRSSLPTSFGFVPLDATKVINDPPPKTRTQSPFQAAFEYVGTLDNTAYLCVREALIWRSRLRYGDRKGEDAVTQWLLDSSNEAAQIISKRLGTSIMQCEGMMTCAFTNIELPLQYDQVFTTGQVEFSKALELARWLEKRMVDQFETFVLIYWHDGKFWARLSGQIYLTSEDWEKAGGWLDHACREAIHDYGLQ